MNKVYKTSEKDRARNKAWREANPEYRKVYHNANKEYERAYSRGKYASDIPFKLRKLVRDAYHRATGKWLGKQGVTEFLGCTIEEYQDYLESKFIGGMTWDNHAVDGWHIDHILPLNESGTTLTEEEKIKRIHYTNTQPLWAKDNIKKGNKLEEDNDV